MRVDTTYRSNAPELMDDFEMEGEVLRDALDKIASINRLLGGNRLSLEGVEMLLQGLAKTRVIRIVDMGCGNGDMLRTLSGYASRNGWTFELIGIDANRFTVTHASALSRNYPDISYLCTDIFQEVLTADSYDIILCTLTLHHFKDDDITWLLQQFKSAAKLGFVINDLQRSSIAYYLFKALCFVFRLNHMSREDGLVSILRGFKKNDLVRFSKRIDSKNYIIRWKWAFRYQWIVKRS
ncbi:methyltransferase domain-containing protein [Pedobacter sp. AW31-3R]|uniref:methyltransferase domain-containing protein n=1 Tax=Pedobacter sp. AW31-3R TaxID=3445781 RepID=UPI003FA0D08D